MAAPNEDEAVRIALESAGLVASDADLADLAIAYRGFREMADRICAVREAEDEPADLIFHPRG